MLAARDKDTIMTDGRLGTTLSGRLETIGDSAHADASPFARLVLGAIESANAILTDTSRDVEQETAQLSELFNRLSDHSQDQVEQLGGLVGQINAIEHDGKSYRLTDLTELFETALDQVTQRVTILSKQGISLIYSLDAIIEQMQDLDACVTEIEGINRQGRLLSLNAQIESGRAGAAGAGFQVVATEMHNMSTRIDSLSERMRENIDTVRKQVEQVIESIRTEYSQLSDVGSMDMSVQAGAKEQLALLLEQLLQRDERLTGVLDRSAEMSNRIRDEVREVVISMQFQDRMTQRTDAVLSALDAILGFMRTHPGQFTDADACARVSREIVDTIPLSDVRSVFAGNLLGDDASSPADAPVIEETSSEDGNIVLF